MNQFSLFIWPVIRGVPDPIFANQRVSAPLNSRLSGCYGKGGATPLTFTSVGSPAFMFIAALLIGSCDFLS